MSLTDHVCVCVQSPFEILLVDDFFSLRQQFVCVYTLLSSVLFADGCVSVRFPALDAVTPPSYTLKKNLYSFLIVLFCFKFISESYNPGRGFLSRILGAFLLSLNSTLYPF